MEIFFPAFAVFCAGFLSGFINIMAGGGSVLTLGLMMLLGLDAPVANGTNRIGVLVGTLSGAAAYKAEKFGGMRQSLVFGLCALPGAILGSIFAVRIENALFQRLLAVVMIFVIITLFLPPSKSGMKNRTHRNWLIVPVMFCIGLYGGFIQAGVGFLIMAALRHLQTMDLVTINLHKTWIVLIYTIPVLLIFGMTRNIHWLYAAALAAGNALGAWLSVKISIRRGEKIIKITLCAAILLMAVKFLYR